MNICEVCSENKHAVIWHVNGFEIKRCINCGLVFANASESDITGIYEIDYYKSIYPDYESDRNVHELNNIQLLQKIEKYFPPGAMIEIGSAFGFFLDSARKRGWDTSGYETSKYASGLAHTKYNQNIENRDFLTITDREKLDVICMFDTIEHLLRPSQYIQKAFNVLKKHGGLVITTGDISSWVARIFRKSWRMVQPPLHIHYFSKSTISSLLKQHGFDVLSISHEAKYQNLNSILKYQFGIKKNAILQVPVKINLGDIMLIIAKKA
jgi:SAM-dependent methyltransferase